MADYFIFDSHTHIYRTQDIGRQALGGLNPNLRHFGTIPELEQVVEGNGVSGAIVLTVTPTREMREKEVAGLSDELNPGERAARLKEINEVLLGRLDRNNSWGCEVGREHPQFLPFINLDPFLMDGESLGRYVRKKVAQGARGIKLLPMQHLFYGNEPALWPAYQVANELGLPILSQSGGGRPPPGQPDPWGRPKYFAEVLEAFPNITLILAHFGTGFEDEMVELVQRYPNVYPDISTRLISEVNPNRNRGWTPEEAVDWIRKAGAERVLFATNWPIRDQTADLEAFHSLRLSEEEKRMVLGENAKRILGL
ncbi:MAG: amidohydrolase family protein [Dehalococcoidia bacterium]